MLFDNKGQTYTEYVVIIGGVLLVAGAIVALFQAIRGVFENATDTVNELGE